jgi:hypothetical protein
LIIYKYLVDNIEKLIQKQKIYTMSASLSTGFLQNLTSWIRKRKKYALSLQEIFYSVMLHLKDDRVRKKYPAI